MMTPFIAEIIGTALLILLGGGVVANVSLKNLWRRAKRPCLNHYRMGLCCICRGLCHWTIKWRSSKSSRHCRSRGNGKICMEFSSLYIVAQVIGAMLGSWLNYLLYIDHYRITEDEDAIRGTFCTAPAIRNFKNNFFSEALGTFVLIFGIFFIATPPL